jgi:hypothetical protein
MLPAGIQTKMRGVRFLDLLLKTNKTGKGDVLRSGKGTFSGQERRNTITNEKK